MHKYKNLKIIVMLLGLVCLLVGVACSGSTQKWQAASTEDQDENVMYKMCYPSAKNCRQSINAWPVYGTGFVPPIGTFCQKRAEIFDCPKNYADLRHYFAPPE